METRYEFFCKLMKILDEAEGERNSSEGAFGFLKESFYVRNEVCSGLKTSITSLKVYLMTEVLQMYERRENARITYNEIAAALEGKATKKYAFYYDTLDACLDIEKNKEAVLQKCRIIKENERLRQYVEETDEWLPYLFMDRLRAEVWSELGEFFKLCNLETYSAGEGKSRTYFKFVQTMALYEIFYAVFIAAEEEKPRIKVTERFLEMEKSLEQAEASFLEVEKAMLKGDAENTKTKLLQTIDFMKKLEVDETLQKQVACMVVHLILSEEFGISLNAMFYILTLLEAVTLSDIDMKGLKNLSRNFKEEIWEKYRKDLTISYHFNRKRAKCYREVSEWMEELSERYCKYENMDYAVAVSELMEELCKPKNRQSRETLRELEVILGHPIYNWSAEYHHKNVTGI